MLLTLNDNYDVDPVILANHCSSQFDGDLTTDVRARID
jgi:hypothetical protein